MQVHGEQRMHFLGRERTELKVEWVANRERKSVCVRVRERERERERWKNRSANLWRAENALPGEGEDRVKG